MRARLVAVAVVVAASLVGGCGGDPVGEQGALGPAKAPKDFTRLPGKGFSIAAPATFTPQNQKSVNGEPKLTLEAKPAHQGDDPTLVAVIRDAKPRAAAADQMAVLEDVKRQVNATDVFRREIRWPGARQAFVVGWTEQTRDPPKLPGPPVRSLQLAVQVDKDLIVDVVATAPAATFDDTQVATVLRTFRLT